jgi:hypothetical protein
VAGIDWPTADMENGSNGTCASAPAPLVGACIGIRRCAQMFPTADGGADIESYSRPGQSRNFEG